MSYMKTHILERLRKFVAAECKRSRVDSQRLYAKDSFSAARWEEGYGAAMSRVNGRILRMLDKIKD